MDGHTHVYQFLPERSDEAIAMVKLHVEEEQLHPYAGVMICKMIREIENED